MRSKQRIFNLPIRPPLLRSSIGQAVIVPFNEQGITCDDIEATATAAAALPCGMCIVSSVFCILLPDITVMPIWDFDFEVLALVEDDFDCRTRWYLPPFELLGADLFVLPFLVLLIV